MPRLIVSFAPSVPVLLASFVPHLSLHALESYLDLAPKPAYMLIPNRPVSLEDTLDIIQQALPRAFEPFCYGPYTSG